MLKHAATQEHTGRQGRPRVIIRKRRGRSGSKSWPGTPSTHSVVSSEVNYFHVFRLYVYSRTQELNLMPINTSEIPIKIGKYY